MPGSFRIGRIAGITIEVHYSWLIIFALLSTSLAIGWFPLVMPGMPYSTYWIMGVIASILLFLSVLAHELAHSLVAKVHGLPVKSITLFIFGGVSNIEREPRSAGVEFVIAIVGPLVSLIIGVAAWFVILTVGGASAEVRAVLYYLGIANILLGFFNLIPGFPLDGGRALRSIIWGVSGNLRKATRWATLAGEVIAVLFIFWGIWLFFTGNFLGGIWLGFIGWFLLSAAQTTNAQVALQSLLRGVRVGEVMSPVQATARADMSLREVVDEVMFHFGLRAVPVTRGDQLEGLITLTDVRHVPRDQWHEVTVGHLMVPLERLHVVHSEQSLNDVLPLMANQDVNQLPVVDNDRLTGMLTRDAVLRFLEVRRGLGRGRAREREDERLPVPR